MVVSKSELSRFVDQALSMESEDDYFALMSRYGVRRTSPEFWAYSDRLHDALLQQNPVQFGMLDFNRLENR